MRKCENAIIADDTMYSRWMQLEIGSIYNLKASCKNLYTFNILLWFDEFLEENRNYIMRRIVIWSPLFFFGLYKVYSSRDVGLWHFISQVLISIIQSFQRICNFFLYLLYNSITLAQALIHFISFQFEWSMRMNYEKKMMIKHR